MLKLYAQDSEDLQIISAAIQDAVVKIDHLSYDRKRRSFIFECQRVCWEQEPDPQSGFCQKTYTGIQINGVLEVKFRNLSFENKKAECNILALFFETQNAPEGVLLLVFKGGGEIRVKVECLELILVDLPDHHSA